MKNRLSSWANNISESPTLIVDSKAKKLKAEGKDVCGFGAGEPDFDTPDFIKEACKKAISEGKTKYIASSGLPALREALADMYMRRKNMSANAMYMREKSVERPAPSKPSSGNGPTP